MRLLLVLLGLAAALPAAALASEPTGYRIVPGHSVGKVTLGEGTPQVIASIGRPGRLGPYAGPEWIYGALQVDTNPTGLTVVGLEIVAQYGATQAEAARYQTLAGIHVGSSVAAVEKAYPNARCNLANRGCALTRGTRTTWFYAARGTRRLTGATPIAEIYLADH
ncbi:MAG: hypothetical protein ABSC56_06470 [Solirubrobacteraceae bacterium]|jgi:hypothetical protein